MTGGDYHPPCEVCGGRIPPMLRSGSAVCGPACRSERKRRVRVSDEMHVRVHGLASASGRTAGAVLGAAILKAITGSAA